jgi:hypothetical protein
MLTISGPKYFSVWHFRHSCFVLVTGLILQCRWIFKHPKFIHVVLTPLDMWTVKVYCHAGFNISPVTFQYSSAVIKIEFSPFAVMFPHDYNIVKRSVFLTFRTMPMAQYSKNHKRKQRFRNIHLPNRYVLCAILECDTLDKVPKPCGPECYTKYSKVRTLYNLPRNGSQVLLWKKKTLWVRCWSNLNIGNTSDSQINERKYEDLIHHELTESWICYGDICYVPSYMCTLNLSFTIPQYNRLVWSYKVLQPPASSLVSCSADFRPWKWRRYFPP